MWVPDDDQERNGVLRVGIGPVTDVGWIEYLMAVGHVVGQFLGLVQGDDDGGGGVSSMGGQQLVQRQHRTVLPTFKHIQDVSIDTSAILGKGGFTIIFRGLFAGERQVAVKSFKDELEGDLFDVFCAEVEVLTYIGSHPHIIEFLGASLTAPETGHAIIILELCAYSLREAPSNWTLLRRQEALYQVAQAVAYLHTLNPKVIHRDLKCANVLITHAGIAKLADFGLSVIKTGPLYVPSTERTTSKMILTSECGTLAWMAPELLNCGISERREYSELVDVYAFGVTMLELLYPGKSVASEGDVPRRVLYLAEDLRFRQPAIPTDRDLSVDPYVGLIAECMCVAPETRPTFLQIVERLGAIVLTHT